MIRGAGRQLATLSPVHQPLRQVLRSLTSCCTCVLSPARNSPAWNTQRESFFFQLALAAAACSTQLSYTFDLGIAVHCCPLCLLSFSAHICACYKLLHTTREKVTFRLFFGSYRNFTQLHGRFDVLLYQSGFFLSYPVLNEADPSLERFFFTCILAAASCSSQLPYYSLTSCYTCVLSPAWLSASPIRSYTASFLPEQLLLLVYAAAASLVLRSLWHQGVVRKAAPQSAVPVVSCILHAKIGAFSEDT